jgi:hypothetical protein
MRIPMDIGVGHYDPPPPDRIDDLEGLLAADRFRFANRLSVRVDLESGWVRSAEYTGGGLVGSTTARFGRFSITVPGQGFGELRARPEVSDRGVRFVQTAGGRTGAPLPRRTAEPPYLKITPPTAWTTLALTVGWDGTVSHELVGASPFPRHWVYDTEGALVGKSGSIDFSTWTLEHSHHNTPWADREVPGRMTTPETPIERTISVEIMGDGRPEIERRPAGFIIIEQGSTATDVYLILDGIVEVDVDGVAVGELGPGCIIGERAGLELGVRTSTVRAVTAVTVAVAAPHGLQRPALEEVSVGHRREDG